MSERRILKEIAPGIWWACHVSKIGPHTFFEGDVFQGQNAEQLAKEWFND